MFALAYLIANDFTLPSSINLSSWAWFALAGVVHFVFGRYGNYRATKAIGSTLSAPLQQISIPVSLALAMYFLDETLTVLRILGILLVIVGPVIATWRPSAEKVVETASGFRPQYREGFVWGVLGATAYGFSPLFIMNGLGADGGLTDALEGGFISYIAASIVILSIVMSAGGLTYMRQLDRTAGNWFLLSSLIVFLSQMFRYLALTFAPVSVIVPIQRMSIIFRVLFSWLVNRDHEVFGMRLLAGIILSLLGTVALTLSTEIVQSALASDWAPGWTSSLATEWP